MLTSRNVCSSTSLLPAPSFSHYTGLATSKLVFYFTPIVGALLGEISGQMGNCVGDNYQLRRTGRHLRYSIWTYLAATALWEEAQATERSSALSHNMNVTDPQREAQGINHPALGTRG